MSRFTSDVSPETYVVDPDTAGGTDRDVGPLACVEISFRRKHSQDPGGGAARRRRFLPEAQIAVYCLGAGRHFLSWLLTDSVSADP